MNNTVCDENCLNKCPEFVKEHFMAFALINNLTIQRVSDNFEIVV